MWQRFMEAAVELGLDCDHDYPFSNYDGGREAVRRYAKELLAEDFVARARIEYGDRSGRLAAAAHDLPIGVRATQPYERVQFDGHRIDQILTVAMPDPAGDETYLPISRIWLLVAIDERSRAVLGYSLSLAAESYTMEDVLECLGRVFEPWRAKPLPMGSVAYYPGAGLPSGIVEGCAWRAFDTLQLDNAWAHHSAWLQQRVLEASALEVVTNKPGNPRENSIVERFFATFEEVTGHRWPNTTGSGPQDPRRRRPERAAKRLQVTFDDLQIIADVAVANYNATPHTHLNGRSPIEFIRYRLKEGRDLIRHVRSGTSASGLSFFERDFDVTVHQSARDGHRPYVKFLYVRYGLVGPSIGRVSRTGTRAKLRIDIRDIRIGRLFIDGVSVGHVRCEPAWMQQPHGIKLRRAIFRNIKQGKLAIDRRAPVANYIEHLASRSNSTAKARSQLLAARRETAVELASKPSSHSTVEPRNARVLRPGSPDWITLGRKIND